MADKKDETKKPFPLERILTVGAQEWIDSSDSPRGATLADYEMVGVHFEGFFAPLLLTNSTTLKDEFAIKVPERTEIVVKYIPGGITRDIDGTFYGTASGTALIHIPQ